jgi:NAD(P)-dependent dehydrogenase (short-subunit alcohol dehydrogenase family)
MFETYKKLAGLQHQPRVLLITGGTSGIGRAAALLFAAMGDHVAVTGRRTDRLDGLREQVEREDLPGAPGSGCYRPRRHAARCCANGRRV